MRNEPNLFVNCHVLHYRTCRYSKVSNKCAAHLTIFQIFSTVIINFHKNDPVYKLWQWVLLITYMVLGCHPTYTIIWTPWLFGTLLHRVSYSYIWPETYPMYGENHQLKECKGGVISEGIFNLVPSWKNKPNHCPSTFQPKVEIWGTAIWFISLRMGPNLKYLLILLHLF